jgi:hypothetical protein
MREGGGEGTVPYFQCCRSVNINSGSGGLFVASEKNMLSKVVNHEI